MGQMVLRCELCVVKTLHFQFFCDREELDAAYRWLQGRSEGSSLNVLWRQVEGARKWAVLQRTNEYVVLCIRKRHSQKSHVQLAHARLQVCQRHAGRENGVWVGWCRV